MPTFNKIDMMNCCRGHHDFSDGATECLVCGVEEEALAPIPALHVNKTLPLPAYLAENEVLQALIEAAEDCKGSDDVAVPFIEAARQELHDRGALSVGRVNEIVPAAKIAATEETERESIGVDQATLSPAAPDNTNQQENRHG